MSNDKSPPIPDAKPAIYRWIIGMLLFVLNYAWNDSKRKEGQRDAALRRADTLSDKWSAAQAEIKIRDRIDSVEEAGKYIYSRDAPVDMDTGVGLDSTQRKTGI